MSMRMMMHVLLSLLVLCLTSCAKGLPVEKDYDVCGTYSLDQMRFFSSDQVDLDGDGKESDNFLDEFRRLHGYSDSLSVATVYRKPSDKNELVIDFHIPYHDVRDDDHDLKDLGCGYIESSLVGRFDGTNDYADNPLVFVNLSGSPDRSMIGALGIGDVSLKEFGVYGQMKIYVNCTIYDSALKPHDETLYMLFMKTQK